ncbi:MAG: hypothetical protein PHI87_06790 [Candidatus Methanomethylophilus sp.]|nr:hypothetical protein [Methanomethylophilus sp.]
MNRTKLRRLASAEPLLADIHCYFCRLLFHKGELSEAERWHMQGEV